MTRDDDLARLTAAYAFAAQMHAGQRLRGAQDAPYLNHVCDVAAMVAEADGDGDAVIAAVLHDVVEDTSATREIVSERFGPAVAALVEWVTDDVEIEALPIDRRKARQAEKIATAPAAARLIKLADQTDNIEGRINDFGFWTGARQAAYLVGARAVAEACGDVAPALRVRFDAAAERLSRLIDEAGARAATTAKETPT